MKTKNIVFTFFIVWISSFFFIGCSGSKNIESLKAGEAFNLVNNRQFAFVAEHMSPLRGRSRTLTSEYSVTINNDSLMSYLPYFGRAYMATIDPSKNSLDFTSTDFSYTVKDGRKDSKTLTIVPKDHSEVQQFFFTIFDNGTTTLQVINTNKDAISYNGYLRRVNKNE